MSSGFVSAGKINNDQPDSSPPTTAKQEGSNTASDEAWRRVQQEMAEARARKEEAAQAGNEGKSLYEVLQANKAAKQEAFEESIRLKNQYRALDDDEAEFLSTVLEEKRRKEDAVRRETAEELERFRRQREEAEKKAREMEGTGVADAPEGEKVVWVAPGRKRRRTGGELLKGVKVRRTSSAAAEAEAAADTTNPASSAPNDMKAENHTTGMKQSPIPVNKSADSASATSKSQPTAPLGLSLGYADSDEDD